MEVKVSLDNSNSKTEPRACGSKSKSCLWILIFGKFLHLILEIIKGQVTVEKKLANDHLKNSLYLQIDVKK